MTFGEILQAHTLEDGALPLAPRQLFAGHSPHALAAAATLTALWPEKRGILSHVARSLRGEATQSPARGVTIEAHFDATAIPPELGDRLLELGFEPDGFARFVPAHFADHYTLKFKVDAGMGARRRMLRAEVEDRCSILISDVQTQWPELEAYLELEIYSETSRRRWSNAALGQDWLADLPFSAGALSSVLPPCTADEAKRLGLPLSLTKHADVHLKIAKGTPAADREALIAKLEDIGFYRVVTWAGNDVCTAQFANGGDARRCFTALAAFFERHGGCSELTLEPVASVWRSRQNLAGAMRLGALPPLVLQILGPRVTSQVATCGR